MTSKWSKQQAFMTWKTSLGTACRRTDKKGLAGPWSNGSDFTVSQNWHVHCVATGKESILICRTHIASIQGVQHHAWHAQPTSKFKQIGWGGYEFCTRYCIAAIAACHTHVPAHPAPSKSGAKSSCCKIMDICSHFERVKVLEGGGLFCH
jgi:hypothetical protein